MRKFIFLTLFALICFASFSSPKSPTIQCDVGVCLLNEQSTILQDLTNITPAIPIVCLESQEVFLLPECPANIIYNYVASFIEKPETLPARFTNLYYYELNPASKYMVVYSPGGDLNVIKPNIRKI